ncbi:glycoside hydrolase [Amphritea opalescens]|uniref:Glycoside hydrolase n=2 Tax=Amphritea opalescens TaxID=2490544 RepID=A0A430KW99_9GAMM|nr:glycoside hydrolase [Amphritea opalescens]
MFDESGEDMAVRQRLLQHYQTWQGVPYRLGGTTKQGVDCSSFTQQAFQQQFGVQLPRTTADQAAEGMRVAGRSLQPGDLLFYRPGAKGRHVGIYVGRGEFLHASTSRGVMISRVDNPYWRQYFWQARRLDY